jgi:hypothetical protein
MEMPKKGELCRLGRCVGSIKDIRKRRVYLLHLPTETRRLLRGIEVAKPPIGEAIDRCARLYQVALVCGAIYPSVGFAYCVAAVEAIVQTTGAGSFSDFMRQHVSTRDRLNDLLNYLHSRVRSAHFHAGEFPSGEFARQPFFDPLMDAEDVLRTSLHSAGGELIHEAIMGWLAAAMPESPRTIHGV